jgi:DICT domain-containing protein
MHFVLAKRTITLALVSLFLCGCAQHQMPVSTLGGDDDDAFCRANNVAVGSSEYIACRKDRDVLRNNAAARADRRQRDLGEYMLNHPDHP